MSCALTSAPLSISAWAQQQQRQSRASLCKGGGRGGRWVPGRHGRVPPVLPSAAASCPAKRAGENERKRKTGRGGRVEAR
eukprot:3423367-Rhodomonas_salina.3